MNPNTELKITAGAVLNTASKCPQAKEILKTLFPQVFEDISRDNEVFCTVGQILNRRGHEHRYAIVMLSKGVFQLCNISQNNFWTTTVRAATELGGINSDGVFTRRMFKKMLDQTSFSIDEFTTVS